MKILHFVGTFIPCFNGTTTRLINILSDSENIHYLYVPYPNKKKVPETLKNLIKQENFGNIRVRRYRPINKKLERIPILDLFNKKKISEIICNKVNDKEIDIVHGHNPLIHAMASMNYAKEKEIPFIYEIHRIIYDKERTGKWKLFPKVFYHHYKKTLIKIEKKISRNASAVIVQTDKIKERAKNLFEIDPKKIYVIPMGVDIKFFDPIKWSNERKKLRNKKNWENKIVFMYNGALEESNGIKFFIETALTLPKTYKEKIKIVILGKGSLKEYIKDIENKNNSIIDFIGLVSYDEMPKYYSASDVHVIPSPSLRIWETNVPTKLLEGMAMERLILSSDVEGVKKIIKNKINGLTYNKDNPGDLREKIIYITENYNKTEIIRKQSRKTIQNNYSWKKFRERLNLLYSTVKESKKEKI